MTLLHRPGTPRLPLTTLALCSALFIAGCGSEAPPPLLEIKTLNNRADMVSGGDALVEVVMPAGVSMNAFKVDLNGTDVTAAFAVRSNGRVLGLVTGMKEGDNVLTASANEATAATLTLTNADRNGPVFSGAQVSPYVCATPVPQGAAGKLPATNASGLGTLATDARCNIATE